MMIFIESKFHEYIYTYISLETRIQFLSCLIKPPSWSAPFNKLTKPCISLFLDET